jgi:IS5 family transposase
VVHLDRGYDSTKTRTELAGRDLRGKIAEKGKPAPVRAGRRWVVLRTHAWGNMFGKLRWFTERRTAVVEFFLALAHAIIITRRAWTTYRWDSRPATPMNPYCRRL